MGRQKEENVVGLKGVIGAIRYFLTPFFSGNPEHHPQKRTIQPGDVFENAAFELGFEIVKF
jgi:hypothetical protein